MTPSSVPACALPRDVPLTAAERAVWLGAVAAPGSAGYNAACILRIEGEFDEARFAAAYEAVARLSGNAGLRVVLGKGGEPLWRAEPCEPPAINLHIAANEALGGALLEEIFRADPLRADRVPLARVHLVRVRPDLRLVMFRHHHVLMDFQANAGFVRRVAACYVGVRPEPVLSRAALLEAENAYRASPLFQEDRTYWRARLGGLAVGALLAPGAPASGGAAAAILAPEEFAAFTAKAHALGATPFQVLLLVLYAQFDAAEDFLCGVPLAGRAAILASLSRLMPFRLRIRRREKIGAALAGLQGAFRQDAARARFPLWEYAAEIFPGSSRASLPATTLNYIRATTLAFGPAKGTFFRVLYGARNAARYVRGLQADGALAVSLDGAQNAEGLASGLKTGMMIFASRAEADNPLELLAQDGD